MDVEGEGEGVLQWNSLESSEWLVGLNKSCIGLIGGGI